MAHETHEKSSIAVHRKVAFILVLVTGIVACGWYAVEPWVLTFIDDGPYDSEEFEGAFDDLPVQSQVVLRRFAWKIFVLESRRLPEGDASVLILKDMRGGVRWARQLVKPDGELGAIEIRRANLRWCGGWRVRIAPERQEAGDLYLDLRGGFRFFNHSW